MMRRKRELTTLREQDLAQAVEQIGTGGGFPYPPSLLQRVIIDVADRWRTLTVNTPWAVHVSLREFRKLSNYPLHRRKRSILAKLREDLSPLETPGEGLMRLLRAILNQAVADAEAAPLGRIYSPPQVTFQWEAPHLEVQLEVPYYEILPRDMT